MPGAVPLKKSTRIWLGVFAVSAAGAFVLGRVSGEDGCVATLLQLLAVTALLVLLIRGPSLSSASSFGAPP